MRERLQNVVLAGVVAGVVVACSGPAMEVTGGVMQDAGAMLQDAGTAMMAGNGAGAGGAGADGDAAAGNGSSPDDAGLLADAGRVLMDAGAAIADAGTAMRDDSGAPMADAGQALVDAGGAMQDAGQALQDAGGDGSVQAQACGQWCTATGAVRMITADQDSTRYFRDTPASGDWTLSDQVSFPNLFDFYAYTIHLRDGPLVLQAQNGGDALFVVAQGASCNVTLSDTDGSVNLPAGAIPFAGIGEMVLGDEALCAYHATNVNAGDPQPPARNNLVLRGYRPYE